MKSATVRQVRHDFGTVLAWVDEGQSVEISKRGQVVAVLSPPPIEKRRPALRPNFAKRQKRLFGDKVFAGNIILEDRNSTER